jgi:L-aspartate oxidase
MSNITASAPPPAGPYRPVVVVGAGLAGLSVALELANTRQVIVLAKRGLAEGATAWAQGGIVGVLGLDDSIESHVRDTQDAGAGLVDEDTARFIAEHSAEAVRWLVDQGVPFSPDPTGPLGLHLTREGGHAVRRIAHAADATGRAIHEALLARARAHPGITLRERWVAVDLITQRHLKRRGEPGRCYGVYALDMDAGRVETLAADAVVLATGGVGKVYRYTSNPDTATGDGIAMAWRAGCRVGNMEFIQFHPTCLYHPQERSFLLTEALRGEGAVLTLPGSDDGSGRCRRFMDEHDERRAGAARHRGPRHRLRDEEARPRPRVARCPPHRRGQGRGLPARTLPDHPCALWRAGHRHRAPAHPGGAGGALHLRRRGHRSRRSHRPAAPVRRGRSHLHGLARGQPAGEQLAAGVRGAGPCLRRRHHARSGPCDDPPLPPWDESQVHDADEQVVIAHNWDELRLLMWNYVGIVRTTKRLERALHRIKLLRDEIDDYYANFRVNRDLLELRNLVVCAELIVRSALRRHESRGLHFSRDFPDTLPVSFPTVLTRPARSGRG